MSEAIWLAGSSLKQSSRTPAADWLAQFLVESKVKLEWITAVHIVQPEPGEPSSAFSFPILPAIWLGGAGQAHFLLGALCREIRAGEYELALLLEKDPASWNASLIASPAFFGPRNRIPAIAILETHAFNQNDAEKNLSERKKYLKQFNLPGMPLPSVVDSPAAWRKEDEWLFSPGLLPALNAAAAWLANRSGAKSALFSAEQGSPAQITILEGL